MRTIIITALFIFCSINSFGQTCDIKKMVDSLKFLKNDSLDCKAELYWRIISQGKKAIPFLIEKLTDTTKTNVSSRCKNSKLNVAEIAVHAITRIASFPMFRITNIQFDTFDERGCWSFYNYFYSNSNKIAFKKKIQNWYSKNKARFLLERIPKANLNQCQIKYGINSYYKWK